MTWRNNNNNMPNYSVNMKTNIAIKIISNISKTKTKNKQIQKK